MTDERRQAGELGQKHGDTIVATLRGIYGACFAPDCQPTGMLSDVLAKLDPPSLERLTADRASGQLNAKLVGQS